ncbi:MaoC family dehydratase [Streptomyces sp. NPDC002580]|uniref:MaoC family dehydratase n=1 Tax=Streptomyces sp. NPDC002580 TaxID=3364653 RepID=UPI0036BCAC39
MTGPLLTDELRALIGRTVVYTAPEPLGRAALRYFANAVGDTNPLWTDSAYARAQGHPDVIAPPTLICETNQYTGLPPDEDGYAGHTWGIRVPGTQTVRGSHAYTFHRPVGPDVRVTATWTLVSLDERVTSGGRPLLVVGSRCRYTDQHGTLLAENEETVLHVALPSEEPR